MVNQVTGVNRDQIVMVSLSDRIAKDNPVRLIDAFVAKLDLKALGIVTAVKNTTAKGGRPSYAPQVFLKLYLYGYLNKIRSSRKLEQECCRNIELHWLLEQLNPNYHSIADFRKDNAKALKNLFCLYVGFMDSLNLLGKETLGIDGTKFRAVNSSKNNYNERKIQKHQGFIKEKAEAYLTELDNLDKAEAADLAAGYRAEEVEAALQALHNRTIKYDNLQQALGKSEEKQISTIDKDSRALIINKNIVEVAYNTQCVVDGKHNLIVHCEATNKNDTQALYDTAMQAKDNLDLKAEDRVAVLADKGYHNGKQLSNCHLQNIETYVAFREQPGVKHLEKEFLVSEFTYNKEENSYTCPAAKILTTSGSWHLKKRESGETSYRFQKYSTAACAHCRLRAQCTKLKYRAIERSEYQDSVDINNKAIREHKDYYRKRQAMCEHPFGTIKRWWGYSYTLLKGLGKVNGEMNLIMLCYNIRRTMSIFGFESLLKAIETWTPDYKRVLCSLKILRHTGIQRQNKSTQLSNCRHYSFLMMACKVLITNHR